MCHSGQVSDDLLTGQKNFQEISGLISEIVLNGPLIGAGQESTKSIKKISGFISEMAPNGPHTGDRKTAVNGGQNDA